MKVVQNTALMAKEIQFISSIRKYLGEDKSMNVTEIQKFGLIILTNYKDEKEPKLMGYYTMPRYDMDLYAYLEGKSGMDKMVHILNII